MQSNSQAHQDLFILEMVDYKKNGTFVEIGSNHPIDGGNNTYLLEKLYGWKGLMIEYDRSFESLYRKERPNSYFIIGDARSIDYKTFLDSHSFPHVDKDD